MLAAVLGVGQGVLIYYLMFTDDRPPILQVDTANLDFGAIPLGVKVERAFRLTNVGASPLVIRRIQTGCGCLEVNLARNSIAPAMSEALQVAMTVESLRKEQIAILVFSNDPSQPIVKLSVKADAVMKSIVEPQVIDFGQIDDSAMLPITKSFRLLLKQDYFRDLKSGYLSFTTNEPYLCIDDSQPPSGNAKEIKLSLQADAPIGDIFTQLLINDPSRSASIRILGCIRGKYFALPQMVVLGPVGPHDDVLSEFVAVKSRSNVNGGQETRVGRPDIGPIELSDVLTALLSVTRTRDGENSGITVTLDPAGYSGLWSSRDVYGHIRIRCSSNGKELEELNVPVLVVLRLPRVRDA